MLSRPQQILLKRAQREAGLLDDDYRDALQMISGWAYRLCAATSAGWSSCWHDGNRV